MEPRRWKDTLRWMIIASVVTLVTASLFVMLIGWILARGMRDGGFEENYPAWYADIDDVSWQLPLQNNSDSNLGQSARRPVKLCGASAEHAYLASVACADDPGNPPFVDPFMAAEAKRESVHALANSHYVDRYEVPCSSGKVDLFLSPYHCGSDETDQAPPGFVPRWES